MKIIICKDSNEASQKAANMIKKVINDNPKAILGLATGSTPIETYKKLIEMNKKKEISFKDVKTVNLDEYISLDETHPQSYRYFMNDNLFNHIDINISNTRVPKGMAKDIEKEAIDYEKYLNKLGGADIQVLGLGENGHIGFNEPGDSLNAVTHIEDLTLSTIKANKRFFQSEKEVPKKAITMGLGSILKAKKIILLAFGEKKAQAIASLKDNNITTKFPVTFLKLHPDVTVLVDNEAASLLNK